MRAVGGASGLRAAEAGAGVMTLEHFLIAVYCGVAVAYAGIAAYIVRKELKK